MPQLSYVLQKMIVLSVDVLFRCISSIRVLNESSISPITHTILDIRSIRRAAHNFGLFMPKMLQISARELEVAVAVSAINCTFS